MINLESGIHQLFALYKKEDSVLVSCHFIVWGLNFAKYISLIALFLSNYSNTGIKSHNTMLLVALVDLVELWELVGLWDVLTVLACSP